MLEPCGCAIHNSTTDASFTAGWRWSRWSCICRRCTMVFVDYDDQQYVTDNPRVQAGLTWTGLVWAFGFHAANWHPLAWLSHMADCQLYGARAGGHHLTNVLLHVASTLLLFSVLSRMMGLCRNDPQQPGDSPLRKAGGPANATITATVPPADAMWRSAAVAALFAWHPLHVELPRESFPSSRVSKPPTGSRSGSSNAIRRRRGSGWIPPERSTWGPAWWCRISA